MGKTYRSAGPMLLLLLAALTYSCSSGGSSSAPAGSLYGQPVAYSGKTTQAAVTAGNALKLFLFAWGGGPYSSSAAAELASGKPSVKGRGTALSFNMLPGQLRRTMAQRAASSKTVSMSTAVNETYSGLVSGTATYSGYVNDDGTGWILVIYHNYNDGDHITYDGDTTLTINGYDPAYDLYTNVDEQMVHLTTQSPDAFYTLTGAIHTVVDIPGNSSLSTFQVDGRNEVLGETFRLQNYSMRTDCDNIVYPTVCSESDAGRVYVQTEGYTDVSTTDPLLFHNYGKFNVDAPDAGGPMLLAGLNGSTARMSPLSVSRFRIETDENGDAAYESTSDHFWYDVTGLVFTWEGSYGTSTSYEEAYSVRQAADGGFVAVGYANTGSTNHLDGYLIKTDAAGTLEWSRTFGGAYDDVLRSVQTTTDGGFILAGYSNGTSGEKVYVVRTDPQGGVVWEKRYDTLADSRAYAVQQTSDGGFIVAGYMDSFIPGVGVVGLGLDDAYLLKLDPQGNIVWDKRFGGADYDHAYSVQETSDGGFIIAGTTSSFPDWITYREQVYLIKTDKDGTLVWQKTFGGIYGDYGYDAKEVPGGGYIVSGNASNSFYLLRTDANGGLLWEQSVSGTGSIYSQISVELARDGGFVVAGASIWDMVLIKFGEDGTVKWNRAFNWSNYLTLCAGFAVTATGDGGYVVAGSTVVSTGTSDKNFYLVKTDALGNSQ